MCMLRLHLAHPLGARAHTATSMHCLDLSSSIHLADPPAIQGPAHVQDRLTLGALITLDVHARDVVQQLVDASVGSTTDFEWVSQLRYYWRNDVWVEMVQASIIYGYEYLGNTPRWGFVCHHLTAEGLSCLPCSQLFHLQCHTMLCTNHARQSCSHGVMFQRLSLPGMAAGWSSLL